ncbi:MAG: dTDP-4-dehydrorhamnose reductase [Gracilimonas sp.]|uniref:dTDP-4-dehydrorhamnose reductase n=1 Tax=Gracilimonas sp. TaxID=1974203 RepID=UPI001B062DA7|nr:dTDP-4-dehydrorhamnose reductase [Gracilimonas sp.]MBO6586105.1 dTDP-4-dehydrorhamnose reductase [Gracilimonas sp.]MBO6614762.1 dTDP-4-dehydrorhamnose reductase [Gracilimonas sp.]
MRILITGGSGQLGREWVDYLNRKEVEFISLPSADLDITDHDDTNRVLSNLRPDLIINCAAYTKVDQAEDEPEKAHQVNREAVKNLADYCAKKNIKLVHFSTDYVFPGTEEDMQELPNGYTEDHPTNPVNAYGESKLAGEKAIRESGCDYLLIRVSWLCGKYGSNFVKTMLKLAEDRDELKVVNDQFGCPTFTKNVVENSWELIDQKEKGIFHLTSTGKITWYDFASEIFKQAGVRINLQPVDSSEFPTKAKRPAFSLLSTEKIANISGVSLIEWEEGLKLMLAELKV